LASLEVSGLADWLVDRGLLGLPLDEQIDGFCRCLVEAGFPARRFNVAIGTLHPRLGARSYIWHAGQFVTEEFLRQRSNEDRDTYLRSPIYHLRSSGELTLRRRLHTDAPDDFPVLVELRDAGMTDYFAQVIPFDDSVATTLRTGAVIEGSPQGIFFSCATDAPHGFDDGHLQQARDLLPYLALAIKARSTLDVAHTVLETYLGADAGRRVLTGEIDRHSVQSIEAVIWLCDLRGFSSVASRVPQMDLVEILGTYLEVLARPVLDHGGEILKFMGDGFLATFDFSSRDRVAACTDALNAAEEVLKAFPRVNTERLAAGKSTLDFGIALHVGEVLYGNIGTRERLDFTVVGSAVNEASRIEGLCRPLQRKVLVSGAFHGSATACAVRLVSLGFHALRGIREPQELFTITDA
jgi:adenylate cyclase